MFYYQIDFWDETDNKRRQESGILAADSYGKATERVARYYGADSISSIISLYLEEWEDILSEDRLLEGFDKADLKVH